MSGKGSRQQAEPLMKSQEVADLLNIHRNTLRDMHENGEGPKAIVLSPRIRRYDPREVARWIKSKRV